MEINNRGLACAQDVLPGRIRKKNDAARRRQARSLPIRRRPCVKRTSICARMRPTKKIASLDPVRKVSCAGKARLTTGLRHDHKLANLLQAAGLSRGTFYYRCQAIPRDALQSDMEVKIRTIYEEHKGRYGYRRITATLCKSMAEPVNHECVQRLVQKMELRALIRAKNRFRCVSSMSDVNVPNVLQCDLFAEAPNQKWVNSTGQPGDSFQKCLR